MLSNAYGEAAISERTCREWFQRFKNGDFDVEDQRCGGREKVFEDAELEALLDQDSCQTKQELAGSLGSSSAFVAPLVLQMSISDGNRFTSSGPSACLLNSCNKKNKKGLHSIVCVCVYVWGMCAYMCVGVCVHMGVNVLR
ncbi:hypothetical protein K1T71_005805 [Dendrolimus kikuchii]|uniref:Uncharacterized protein n=1 Tax=Dendrolimus kikuchii TaxID=765133 RepID=A0ACC1D5F2_9NEOP|nr:hypothetical protein K1T71_005805 [Dendrolimus kikuchii]